MQGDKKSIGNNATQLHASAEAQKFFTITNEDLLVAVRMGGGNVTASDNGRLLRPGESVTFGIPDGVALALSELYLHSVSGTVDVSWCAGG